MVMRNKTLIVALVALLISNGIFAYLLVSKKKHGSRHEMVANQMKQIGFDKTQIDSFIAMRKASKEAAQPILDSLQAARKKYINAVVKNLNDSLTNITLLNESNKWVLKLDMHNYNSLQEAKKLCKPDQVAAYDSLVMERMLFIKRKTDKDKK